MPPTWACRSRPSGSCVGTDGARWRVLRGKRVPGTVGRVVVDRVLVPVTLMMHGFWRLHDPQAVHIQQAMFLKSVALMGGALLLSQVGPGL